MNGILTYVDDWIDMAIMQNVTDTNKSLVASDVISDLQKRSLIIFDFDGTMADTLPTIVSTAKMAMTDCGHTDFIESDLKKLVGPPFPYAFELVFGLSHEDAVAVTKRYRELYVTTGKWPLFEGMRDLIDDLHAAGKKVAVASSKNQPMLEMGLRDNNLIGVLDTYAGRIDEAATDKITAIAYVMRQLGFNASESVMVGDRRYDMEAAFPNKIPCIGVLYGKTTNKQELIDAGAVAIVDTVEDLHHVLLA